MSFIKVVLCVVVLMLVASNLAAQREDECVIDGYGTEQYYKDVSTIKYDNQTLPQPFDKHDYNKNVLMYVKADWCAPCKRQTPIVESLKDEGYIVYTFDSDDDRELLRQFDVKSLPTIFIWDKGEIVKKHVGITSKMKLQGDLKKAADQDKNRNYEF